jgi:hypothetical protein
MSAGYAQAETGHVYGVSGGGEIFKVNLSDGLTTTLLNTEIVWYGATDSSQHDMFYATPKGGSLYEITIVPDGDPIVNPVASYDGPAISDLAYNELTGQLFGTDYYDLYTIDPVTGSTMLVASWDTLVGAWAMDFSPSLNKLVVVDQYGPAANLRLADPVTGALQTVGQLTDGSAPVNYISDVWYDPASESMYAISSAQSMLYHLDTSTAVATPIGASNSNILGLGTPVPEPATALMLVLGVGIAWMPFARRRCR